MTSLPGSPIDLILVRHARPEVSPDLPAGAWPLSAEGAEAAHRLGERLHADFGPLRVVTSRERKAIETGEVIAGSPVTTDDRLGEQGLGTVPFLPSDAFRERVLAHFRRPGDRVLGDESSSEAASRFAQVVAVAVASPDAPTPVLISHGRVISAWLAMAALPVDRGAATVSAESIWMTLRMPDAILLRRDGDGWRYRRIAEEMDAGR